jgi:fructosamine-3-kinase
MLPAKITSYLKNELNIDVRNTRSVSGGSINRAVKVTSKEGDLFLKWNGSAPDDFFEKEADGLNLLKSAGTGLRIPEVIATEKPVSGRPGFLLMEYIDKGHSGDSFAFGAELAALHQTRSEQFGLANDNYIGSLPQSNRQHTEWTTFFYEERITPQLKMAIDSNKMNSGILKHCDRMASKLDGLFPPAKPSLILGDLWGGNYLFDSNGAAALIDPAVYFGHPEMDLAFSKMFGGFSADFYEGYQSVTQIEAEFSERVPVYNLYPLLVHVNLFGAGYTRRAEQILMRF